MEKTGKDTQKAEGGEKLKKIVWRFPFDLHEPNFNGFKEVRQTGSKIKLDAYLISDIFKMLILETKQEKNHLNDTHTHKKQKIKPSNSESRLSWRKYI